MAKLRCHKHIHKLDGLQHLFQTLDPVKLMNAL